MNIMDRDKRKFRELKRTIKRAGSKHRRRDLKRQLREHPEEAHEDRENFGRYGSAPMNAHDKDATRKKTEEEEE
jgi:hypothetical protein